VFSSSLDLCTYVVSGAHLQIDVQDDDDDDDAKQNQQLTDTSHTTGSTLSSPVWRRRSKPCVVSGRVYTIRNWLRRDFTHLQQSSYSRVSTVLQICLTVCKRFIFLSILFLLHTRSSQLSVSHWIFTLYATGSASVQISNTRFVSGCFYTIGIYIVSTLNWRPQCYHTLAVVEAPFLHLKACPHYTQLVRLPRRVYTATSRDEFRQQVAHLLPRHVQRVDGRMLSSQSSVLPRRTSECAQHAHELRPASIRHWP